MFGSSGWLGMMWRVRSSRFVAPGWIWWGRLDPPASADPTWLGTAGDAVRRGDTVEARWRILTVHHLDGNKANCRWWNLAALCQRCHLTIQGRVRMERVWPWPHTEWFRPYAAGFYAFAYLGEEVTREEAEARMDELLSLEAMVE